MYAEHLRSTQSIHVHEGQSFLSFLFKLPMWHRDKTQSKCRLLNIKESACKQTHVCTRAHTVWNDGVWEKEIGGEKRGETERSDMGFETSWGRQKENCKVLERERGRTRERHIGRGWEKHSGGGRVRKRGVRVKETDRGKEEILNIHPSPGYGACELR